MVWGHRAHRGSGRDRRWRRRLARTGILAGTVLAVLVLAGTLYLFSLPGVGDAPQRVDQILRAHGGTGGAVPPPAKLAAAVVAVEDENFYANVVIDVFAGASRAALAALQTSGDPGGSTIVEQLGRQLYGNTRGLAGTLREVGLGLKLSVSYPKPELLAMYLDAVYFGHKFWGDVAAAQGYFGLSPNHLDWAQAALLAGLPQAPSAYDPLVHYALAKQRQLHVLNQLVANHYLTAGQARAAYQAPLGLRQPSAVKSGRLLTS